MKKIVSGTLALLFTIISLSACNNDTSSSALSSTYSSSNVSSEVSSEQVSSASSHPSSSSAEKPLPDSPKNREMLGEDYNEDLLQRIHFIANHFTKPPTSGKIQDVDISDWTLLNTAYLYYHNTDVVDEYIDEYQSPRMLIPLEKLQAVAKYFYDMDNIDSYNFKETGIEMPDDNTLTFTYIVFPYSSVPDILEFEKEGNQIIVTTKNNIAEIGSFEPEYIYMKYYLTEGVGECGPTYLLTYFEELPPLD